MVSRKTDLGVSLMRTQRSVVQWVPYIRNSSDKLSKMQTRVQPLYCATALFKVLNYKVKNAFFILYVFDFMYFLSEKYYKSITVQYYIANYVSWVCKLPLLDLWTNWMYKCTCRMELIYVKGT